MPSQLTVAAVQIKASTENFLDRLERLVGRAASQGAELVVLPQDIGLFFASENTPAVLTTEPGASTLHQLREQAQDLETAYTATFSKLASHFQVYIAAGTIFLPRADGFLVRTAHLLAPGGRLLGTQGQTRHEKREQAGLGVAQNLEVLTVGSHKVGLVIGMDIHHPEVSRTLRHMGAELLIHPAAWPTTSPPDVLRALWREIQANQVFGIESCLIGEGFFGTSIIQAPAEMTPKRSGILAQAITPFTEEIVMATLDFERLSLLRAGTQ